MRCMKDMFNYGRRILLNFEKPVLVFKNKSDVDPSWLYNGKKCLATPLDCLFTMRHFSTSDI